VRRFSGSTRRQHKNQFLRFGIATAAKIEIDNLAQRIRNEILAKDGVIFAPLLIGAWARHPGLQGALVSKNSTILGRNGMVMNSAIQQHEGILMA
jgi:hypothetical protein